ncbi:hypothetical protein NITLEN_90133 [Nitrospira lenta]|uniref:Uncharacterized protein n=1 Tax=Nitrospira lenta TaxID=1436998 RepID=A0A330LAU7_9BACT|nr:hypothetical protein NITLEN_90133 [Nitrospira lenta]
MGLLDAVSIVCPGTVESNFVKGTETGGALHHHRASGGSAVCAAYVLRGASGELSGTLHDRQRHGEVRRDCRRENDFADPGARLTVYAGVDNVQQFGAGLARSPALHYKIPPQSK